MTFLAYLAAMLAGCTVPTMPDPQTPADIARAAQVTEHTVVDGNERYSDPVDGRCADGLVPVRVAAWMEMARLRKELDEANECRDPAYFAQVGRCKRR